MAHDEWVHDDNAALFTDLYQLTMLQAYHLEGMNETAVFDLFMRRIPNRNYLVACGLDSVLRYLETFRFTPEACDYLASLGHFKPEFLDYLSRFRFNGDVYAVPEGTPVFPEEPILEVVAPIGEAQLIETFLLNQITFQTNMATKAHRVAHAARGRLVADFGMRRMHSADAALKAVRAYYIAGIPVTSNVLGAFTYGIPPTGTMAHSYIEAHDQEDEAFSTFASIYPNTTLLVDTYDTLAGIRKIVALAREQGESFQIKAVRLDSGDLDALSRAARRILDEGGLADVSIFASGSLDEHEIDALVRTGAPIDGFGVGTRMGTSADQPYLDSAYKLSSYAGEHRMKLSAHKSNLPGRKQIYRFVQGDKAVRDVIATGEEAIEGGTPLLQRVMHRGQRTEAGTYTLDEACSHAKAALSQLPGYLLALDKADPPYPVDISPRLEAQVRETREKLQKAGKGRQAPAR